MFISCRLHILNRLFNLALWIYLGARYFFSSLSDTDQCLHASIIFAPSIAKVFNDLPSTYHTSLLSWMKGVLWSSISWSESAPVERTGACFSTLVSPSTSWFPKITNNKHWKWIQRIQHPCMFFQTNTVFQQINQTWSKYTFIESRDTIRPKIVWNNSWTHTGNKLS